LLVFLCGAGVIQGDFGWDPACVPLLCHDLAGALDCHLIGGHVAPGLFQVGDGAVNVLQSLDLESDD
jgi:hypothetical protein